VEVTVSCQKSPEKEISIEKRILLTYAGKTAYKNCHYIFYKPTIGLAHINKQLQKPFQQTQMKNKL